MANTVYSVAQMTVRTFLSKLGGRYDVARGLPPFGTSKRHRREIVEVFDGSCAYCGTLLAEPHFDHLVALNRESGGLHAWGNVVPACKRCNDAKGSKPWASWMATVHPERSTATILAFVDHYGYAPPFDIRALAERLYAETLSDSNTRLERFVAEAAGAATPDQASDSAFEGDAGAV